MAMCTYKVFRGLREVHAELLTLVINAGTAGMYQ